MASLVLVCITNGRVTRLSISKKKYMVRMFSDRATPRVTP